jgi:predicted GTPase
LAPACSREAIHIGSAIRSSVDGCPHGRCVCHQQVDSALPGDIQVAEAALRAINATAVIVHAASPITLDDSAAVRGKRVLVIEDGPTITHGDMPYGAGYLAAIAAGAEVVDPRPAAFPQMRQVFEAYPHIGNVLPAVGYDAAQLAALQTTINRANVDVVVSATPIDLARLLRLEKKLLRARYEFAELDAPRLSVIVDDFVKRKVHLGKKDR